MGPSTSTGASAHPDPGPARDTAAGPDPSLPAWGGLGDLAGPNPALDNWAWHALTGPQAHLAERHGRAVRYPRDVSPFAAIDDHPDPDAWADLVELVGPGRTVGLFRGQVELPDGWEVLMGGEARQMVLPSLDHMVDGPDGRPEEWDTGQVAGLPLRRLGIGDVEAMLDLVERTKPGPFLTGTIRLGTYLGVHDRDRLVAIAGERIRPPGWTEVSAVCTDPAYRGRGLAAELVRRVTAGIFARGDRALLHVAAVNTPAISVYERIGFVHRRGGVFLQVRTPG
jgi:ribosomal protein S18 acetylase RimI-like enzyme